MMATIINMPYAAAIVWTHKLVIITQYHSFQAPQGTTDTEAAVSPLPVDYKE